MAYEAETFDASLTACSSAADGASRSQRLELGARGWMDQVAGAGEIDMQGGL